MFGIHMETLFAVKENMAGGSGKKEKILKVAVLAVWTTGGNFRWCC